MTLSCAQIVTHINKEYGVDLDVEVSLPKIKGNFKGTHTAVFESRNARVIPMTEEESVEDMFRSLAEKKTSAVGKGTPAAVAVAVAVGPTTAKKSQPDPTQTVLTGYMEKEGRSMFANWNRR
jgi:hypothetical protein